MVADLLGIELEELEVEATGLVDVRGTLNLDPSVPVGFGSMAMTARLRAAAGTPPRALSQLTRTAERLCVNRDTLRHGVPVDVTFDVATGAPAAAGASTRSDET